MLYESSNAPQTSMKLRSCEEPSCTEQNQSTVVQVFNSEERPGYQVLPKRFFKYDGIPPPLVRISWLKLLYGIKDGSFPLDDEFNTSESETEGEGSSKEDSIPLSDLKLKLSNEEICDIRNDICKTSTIVIQRKRGRPKKQLQLTKCDNIDPSNNHDDTVDELNLKEDQDSGTGWWNANIDLIHDNELYVNNIEVTDIQENFINACEESTVYGLDEEENTEVKQNKLSNNKKIKKKEINNGMTGIKMENSKVIFPCMECGKIFSAASTLKYHLRIHNGTLIKCPECDRGFTTNYLLKCHMRIHSGDLFMCHKCGRGFTTAELLKVHSRSHTGIRPYKCNVCGKSFPSASNLTQHKETHEPEKKYLCFQCGSSFSQKRCLDGHMLSHGEKNHICTVCGKLWARKSDLTEHMRVHTGYKPYACSNCPQKFSQASSLKRHQMVHMDATPIQCVICGKMLKCDEYYKRHMKKHLKVEGQQMTATQ